MKNHRDDIFWGIIVIIAVWMILFRIPIFVLIVLSVIAVCMKFPLGGKEEYFWENQPHHDIEPDHIPEPLRDRPSYSLRVDESLFWENQNHDEEDPEVKTDYSQVDPCFRGDNKKYWL